MSRQCQEEAVFIDIHGPSAGCDCCSEDIAGDSLWPYIDLSKVKVLNATTGHDKGKYFLKAFDKRKRNTEWLESEDDDPEILIYIPFSFMVNIKAISLRPMDDYGPLKMKAYKDKEGMDFETVYHTSSLQNWECINQEGNEAIGNGIEFVDDLYGGYIVDYATKYHKWQHTSSITIHLSENISYEEIIKIFYIGLKGIPTQIKTGVRTVDCVYESMPQVEDHKTTTSLSRKYFI